MTEREKRLNEILKVWTKRELWEQIQVKNTIIAEQRHRAEVAERAFSNLVHEMYENGIRPICDEKFLIESRLEDAEKEISKEN